MSPQMTFFEILISTIRYGQEFQKDVSEETCGIDSESEFKNFKHIIVHLIFSFDFIKSGISKKMCLRKHAESTQSRSSNFLKI